MAWIEANTREEAWEVLREYFPADYVEDELSSQRAGYSIYRSTVDQNAYVSDLGNRLEVNLSNGKTVNIRIFDDTKDRIIKDLESKITDLSDKLDKELEWKDATDMGTKMSQEDYEDLEKVCGHHYMSGYEASTKVSDEFGFSIDKIQILDIACSYEVNRHNKTRVKETFDRSPFWNATDWNYIRFDVCGWSYEMIDGELFQYIN